MKAIVLFSGGVDSTVLLVNALEQERQCLALTFNYGQRNFREELRATANIALYYSVEHKIIDIDKRSITGSSLIDRNIDVPKNREQNNETPNTYVPGRNTIFLAHALSQAEVFNADEVYIGAMAEDAAYPDCKKGFIDAFQNVFNQTYPCNIIAPFLEMSKKDIVELGKKLGVPYNMTFSCYDPPKPNQHCGLCDACKRRISGFENGTHM
jgi:7-cyano-7-deazaguanine synthase